MSWYISDLVITVRFYLVPLLKLTYSALRLTITQYATSKGSGATVHLEPSPFANFYYLTLNPSVTTIVIYSPLLSLIFFSEISSNETPHNGGSGMEMHCLLMSHKVIMPANCFIPITHAQ